MEFYYSTLFLILVIWNRNNFTKIDHVIVTLDSHQPEHIAHARMWKDSNNNPPAVFTQISSQNIKDNVWTPTNGDKDYAIAYTEKLESKGKFCLTIWPEHCILGTREHEIYPTLKVALEEWNQINGRNFETVMKVCCFSIVFSFFLLLNLLGKGKNIKTEMYSALEAEIPDENDPGTWLNHTLLDHLKSFDQVRS